MTDLFAQEGITFESSNMASTAPSTTPDAITAPKINLPDSSPIAAGPNSGQQEKDLIAAGNAQGNASDGLGGVLDTVQGKAPIQANTSPRDLFAEQGIDAPDITVVNSNAFNSGVSVPPIDTATTYEQKQPQAAPLTGPVSKAEMSLPPGSNELDQFKPVQNYNKTDEAQIMDLAKSRFTPAQLEAWKNNPITFTEAFSKLHNNQILPGGGFSQLYDSADIMRIGKKVEAGEAITPEDKTKLNSFVDEQVEQRVRGFSWGGKIAYVGSQIPAFVTEFALSDGAGKVAQVAAKGIAEEAALHGAVTASLGVASRVATTTALMPAQYSAKYGERRLNDIMAITDKGDLIFKQSEESPAKSALLAFAHTGADAAGQIAAPGIGKYIVNPVTKAVSTPLIAAVNALPVSVKMGLYQAYKVMQPSAQVSKVFSAAGWQGMLEQLGANRVSEVLHASLNLESDKNMTMDQYLDQLIPSKDQLMVEGGLIAIGGAIHTSASVAVNLMKSKGVVPEQASEAVNNMTAQEKDNYVNDNLPTPKSGYDKFSPPPEDPPGGSSGGLPILPPEVRGAGGNSNYRPNIPIESPTIHPDITPDLVNSAEGLSSNEEASPFVVTPMDEHWYGKIVGEQKDAPDSFIVDLKGAEILDGNQAHINGIVEGDTYKILRMDNTRYNEKPFTTSEWKDIKNIILSMLPDNVKYIEADRETGARQGLSSDKQKLRILVKPQLTPEEPKLIMADETPLSQPQTILSDATAIKTQTDSAEKASPHPINNDESNFNYLNRALFNDKAAAEEPYNNAIKSGFVPGKLENTPMMMSLAHQIPELVRSHTQVNTFKWDENGNVVNTGKSLKAVLDDYDNYFITKEPNRETRRKDFEDFLIARHYLSLEETAPHVTVTDEQKAKSVADLSRLAVKFGEDLHFFEEFGNEFVAYRNRTRDLLVGNLLSPAMRQKERDMFPYSVPLKREMEPKEYEAALSRGDYAGLTPGNLSKHLKGSALPVKNILHSTLRESARILDFVQRNRVNESIYKLREFAPDKVQETQLPIVKKGTAEFNIAHDPKLREKLQKTIEFLGGKLERADTGKKNQLGSYSPMENLVRMKIGSTEGTLAHEVGHMLDHHIQLKERMLGEPKVKTELRALAEDRLNSEHELADTEEGLRFKELKGKSTEAYVKYIKNDDEIIANFFDAYVNSPEQVDRIAPHAKAEFEKIIDENDQLAFIRDIKPSTSRKIETVKKDVYGTGDLPANTIAFWKNGQKKFIKVSKPMFESLSSMRPSQVSNASKFFSTTLKLLSGAGPLRFGATSTPEFALRNVVRDASEASVQSGVKYNPSYIPKTLYKMLTKDADYQEFVQAGGKFASFMALDDGNIEKSFEDILNPKSTFRKLIRHPLEAYEKIPKASETLTRFGVYRAAIDQGYSPVEAAQYALDATLNFPRGGFATKAANQYIPFLNVGFLATERLVKGFKNDPKTMTLRGITYLTTPALVMAGYYLYGADEKTRNEWLELPTDMIASGRIYFKYNNEWRYIPSPYALGYMFSGLPQMALRSLHEKNPDDGKVLWESLMKGMLGAVSPVSDWSSIIPPTLKTMLEDITNYDFFRGRNIYSKFKEGDNVLGKDKTNSYDSETAKAIGNLFNKSPALIDHTILGLFGGVGGYALKASDAGINAVRRAEGVNVPQKPSTGADVPLEKAFTVRAPEGTRSNSYQGFQKHLLDAQAIDGHLKNLPGGPDKAEYQKDNARELSMLGMLKAQHKQIQNNTKQINAIYTDANMTSEEKTQRIAILEQQITRIARNANNQYNAAMKGAK